VLLCTEVGKRFRKLLSVFEVLIRRLDSSVAYNLGELAEDRVVYLDWRGNCEEFMVGWQSSIMNGLTFMSLGDSVILGHGPGVKTILW
jgi:hypothetical protein